jgi:hypothetical protein
MHRLGCGHSYCHACLRKLLSIVMHTAETVPITCCRHPIPATLLKLLLTEQEHARFVALVVNLDSSRLRQASCPQCHVPLDEAFTHLASSPHELACHKCDFAVCRKCVNKAHLAGQACPAVCPFSHDNISLSDHVRTGRLTKLGLRTGHWRSWLKRMLTIAGGGADIARSCRVITLGMYMNSSSPLQPLPYHACRTCFNRS